MNKKVDILEAAHSGVRALAATCDEHGGAAARGNIIYIPGAEPSNAGMLDWLVLDIDDDGKTMLVPVDDVPAKRRHDLAVSHVRPGGRPPAVAELTARLSNRVRVDLTHFPNAEVSGHLHKSDVDRIVERLHDSDHVGPDEDSIDEDLANWLAYVDRESARLRGHRQAPRRPRRTQRPARRSLRYIVSVSIATVSAAAALALWSRSNHDEVAYTKGGGLLSVSMEIEKVVAPNPGSTEGAQGHAKATVRIEVAMPAAVSLYLQRDDEAPVLHVRERVGHDEELALQRIVEAPAGAGPPVRVIVVARFSDSSIDIEALEDFIEMANPGVVTSPSMTHRLWWAPLALE